MKTLTLHVLSSHKTIAFAASELADFGARMQPGLKVTTDACQSEAGGITLGLFPQTGHGQDDDRDDAIFVSVNNGSGVITGSNPWSVLFGVYRFLEACGCRWVRHGENGDYVPQVDVVSQSVHIDEKASLRHRGLCIEGAVTLQNMLDNIHWAAKVGYNSYFIEFINPHTFFDRYHKHLNNPFAQPETISPETVMDYKRQMEEAISLRSIRYHAVGHAFTCESLGLPGLGWDAAEVTVSEEIRALFAEFNGKRDLFRGVPLNTNLCYSNPVAREKMVRFATAYVRDNPQIDVLQFWLADESRNHCECPECAKANPADFYVMILNELDAALTEAGLGCKVSFIVYEDTLWAPLREKINNPDRFIMLGGLITRSYSEVYAKPGPEDMPGPYVRNKTLYPAKTTRNLALFNGWKEVFSGDTMLFEYYYMWDHLFDPGYMDVARRIHLDMKAIKELGFDGLIDDQTQRSFFPHGLGMYVMGRTMWDAGSCFEDMEHSHLEGAFGQDWQICRDYFNKLSALFDPAYLRGEKAPRPTEHKRDFNMWPIEEEFVAVDPEIPKRLAEIPSVVEAFLPVIERNATNNDPCRQQSWGYLRHHAEMVTMLAKALLQKENGDAAAALATWQTLAAYVARHEDEYQSALDVYEYIYVLESKFINETK